MASTILAIDPGPIRSGVVWYEPTYGIVTTPGIMQNDELLTALRNGPAPSIVVIEKIESFGMAVGREVFETVYWSGRFAEAAQPVRVDRIGRRAVKLHLCGSARAKDANIRQALIDRYGGKEAAIGRKASPGPLYGIAGDLWAALAVAVAYMDGAR